MRALKLDPYPTKVRNWPLFGLTVRTDRLELRLPDLGMLDELAEVAARGVHDSEVMPFARPWTDLPPPWLERSVIQYGLLQIASWKPERWTFNAVVLHDGRVIGTQDMVAKEFAISRGFSTGSWLGREFQGKGFGREMRAAILHLGFAGLGAQEAASEAFIDNPASLGVSRSLGYEPNGMTHVARRGQRAAHMSLRLTREQWSCQRHPKVQLEGLEPCLELMGLTPSKGGFGSGSR